MSELIKKLHNKKDNIIEDITLYSTSSEVGDNYVTLKTGGVTVYAPLGTSEDENASKITVKRKSDNTEYKVLKEANTTGIGQIKAFRNDETFIQDLPNTLLVEGERFYLRNDNAPTIEGYDFVLADPNNFIVTKEFLEARGVIKVYYVPNTIHGNSRKNWYHWFAYTPVTGSPGLNSGDNKNFDLCNTYSATNMEGMFYNQGSQLRTAPKMNMSNVTNINQMFYSCALLKEVFYPGTDLNWVQKASQAFYGCETLSSLDLSSMKNIIDMSSICKLCYDLVDLILPSNMANVYTLNQAFLGCKELEEINFKGTKLGESGHFQYMDQTFKNCYVLNKVDLTGTTLNKVTTYQECFSGCFMLSEIVGAIDLSSSPNVSNMFSGVSLKIPVQFKNVPRDFDLSNCGTDNYVLLNFI